MIDFLMANISEVGTLIMAAGILIYAIITKQWLLTRSTALSLMLTAEKLMRTEQGREKMEWVLTITWDKLPAWFKKFVPENKLKEKLQEWYDMAKDMII